MCFSDEFVVCVPLAAVCSTGLLLLLLQCGASASLGPAGRVECVTLALSRNNTRMEDAVSVNTLERRVLRNT